jgi:hypothetical protein
MNAALRCALLATLAMGAMPTGGHGQPDRKLVSGATVRVTAPNRLPGATTLTFLSNQGDSMAFDVPRTPNPTTGVVPPARRHVLSRIDIESLEVFEGSAGTHVSSGMGFGALVGGLGGLISAPDDGGFGPPPEALALIGAAVGSLIGGVIGSTMPRGRWVAVGSSRPATTVRVSPSISSGTRGMRHSLRPAVNGLTVSIRF